MSARRSSRRRRNASPTPFMYKALAYTTFVHKTGKHHLEHLEIIRQTFSSQMTLCYEVDDNESISDAKLIVVIREYDGRGLVGDDARKRLGLPCHQDSVLKACNIPANHRVFVSTKSKGRRFPMDKVLMLYFHKTLRVSKKRSRDDSPIQLALMYDGNQGLCRSITSNCDENLVVMNDGVRIMFFKRDTGQYICQMGETCVRPSSDLYNRNTISAWMSFPTTVHYSDSDGMLYIGIRTNLETNDELIAWLKHDPSFTPNPNDVDKDYNAPVVVALKMKNDVQFGAENVRVYMNSCADVRKLYVDKSKVMCANNYMTVVAWDKDSGDQLFKWCMSENAFTMYFELTEKFMFTTGTIAVIEEKQTYDVLDSFEDVVDDEKRMTFGAIAQLKNQDTDSTYIRIFAIGDESSDCIYVWKWSAERNDISASSKWLKLYTIVPPDGPHDYREVCSMMVRNETLYANYSLYCAAFRIQDNHTLICIDGFNHFEGDTNEMWDGGPIYADAYGSMYVSTACDTGARRCVIKRFDFK